MWNSTLYGCSCVCVCACVHIWARSTLIQKLMWLLCWLYTIILLTVHKICNALCYIFKHITKRMYKSPKTPRKRKGRARARNFLYFFLYLAMNRKINQNDDDAPICAMSIQITLSSASRNNKLGGSCAYSFDCDSWMRYLQLHKKFYLFRLTKTLCCLFVNWAWEHTE